MHFDDRRMFGIDIPECHITFPVGKHPRSPMWHCGSACDVWMCCMLLTRFSVRRRAVAFGEVVRLPGSPVSFFNCAFSSFWTAYVESKCSEFDGINPPPQNKQQPTHVLSRYSNSPPQKKTTEKCSNAPRPPPPARCACWGSALGCNAPQDRVASRPISQESTPFI